MSAPDGQAGGAGAETKLLDMVAGLPALLFICGIVSALAAAAKARSVGFWGFIGLVTGPIGVLAIWCMPSRRPARVVPVRSLAQEIRDLEELRDRGIITEEEFAQGKAQVLAWPVTSPIPPALTPGRVRGDGRRARTWADYQPPARAAMLALARRHRLEPAWRDDLRYEVACTYAVGPAFHFTLGLEQGAIECLGDGWALPPQALRTPEAGLPEALSAGLDALIAGRGRLVVRAVPGGGEPFAVSLQMRSGRGWRTLCARRGVPFPPLWRRTVIAPVAPGRSPADRK